MSHKIDEGQAAPLCRYCAKPISKATTTVYFGRDPLSGTRHSENRIERPTSKAEAQRYLNQAISSVRWKMRRTVQNDFDSPLVREFIDQVTVWDGRSYCDEFFCNGTHAQLFGYAAARGHHGTKAWVDAMSARRAP